jgi:hypothetical protein
LLLIVTAVFCSASFLAYGASCLYSDWMRAEFERYGLSGLRVLTGVLEILGAAGLLLGLVFPLVGLLAAGGLTVLMIGAFGIRMRIRDSLLQTIPAMAYLLITIYLTILFAGAHN